MKRLFIAIKIIPDKNMLIEYSSLRQEFTYDQIRWVEPDKFHLTLKFLGDAYEDSISSVNKVIIDTLRSKRSFNIELIKTGIFGSKYDPRVIWFGISDNEYLNNIAIELIDSLHNIGFKKDKQNFVPHLTVGRIKKIQDKRLFQKSIDKYRETYFQKSIIESVELLESVMLKHGPIYNVISSYKLANNPMD